MSEHTVERARSHGAGNRPRPARATTRVVPRTVLGLDDAADTADADVQAARHARSALPPPAPGARTWRRRTLLAVALVSGGSALVVGLASGLVVGHSSGTGDLARVTVQADRATTRAVTAEAAARRATADLEAARSAADASAAEVARLQGELATAQAPASPAPATPATPATTGSSAAGAQSEPQGGPDGGRPSAQDAKGGRAPKPSKH